MENPGIPAIFHYSMSRECWIFLPSFEFSIYKETGNIRSGIPAAIFALLRIVPGIFPRFSEGYYIPK